MHAMPIGPAIMDLPEGTTFPLRVQTYPCNGLPKKYAVLQDQTDRMILGHPVTRASNSSKTSTKYAKIRIAPDAVVVLALSTS